MNHTILKNIWVAAFFSSFLMNQALATETFSEPIKQEVSKEKFAEAYRPLAMKDIASQSDAIVKDVNSSGSNVVTSVNALDELPNSILNQKALEEDRIPERTADSKSNKNFFATYLSTTQNLISKSVDFFNPISKDADSLIGKYKKAKDSILAQGMQYIGIKYKWGGTSEETGFDCSGLVRAVFQNSVGMTLPRTAMEMSKVGKKIPKMDNLKPGDLVFFNTMRRKFSHVGIYLGDNKFLHSPRTGAEVRVEEMDASYWRKRFNGATRIEVNNIVRPDIQ
jgi:cell wall-associated NlpC family hydrolase